MPRSFKKPKPLIYIFCEGESEEAYASFLRDHFSEVAVIKNSCLTPTRLFLEAFNKFEKDMRYKDNIDIIDEIWFFFDIEATDSPKCKERFDTIKKLRKLRGKNNSIKVRLLMTTACVEYWFMLHYQMLAPTFSNTVDKENIRRKLEKKVPGYKKGDKDTIGKIAECYRTAAKNGTQVLSNLMNEGLPTLEDTDERNKWLHQSGKTFTTVQEAIKFLEELKCTINQ